MQVKGNSARVLRVLAEMSTGEVVVAAQGGNREAFGELFRRYGHRVRTYALHKCADDRSSADDVASEVWLRVQICIDGWEHRVDRDGDDFVRWLFGLVRASASQVRRARWSQVPAEAGGSALHELEWLAGPPAASADDSDADGDSADRVELVDRLAGEIGRLSATSRRVVQMRLDGAGSAEIARRTGLTGKQVTAAWRRAQVTLRRRLVGRLDIDAMSEADRAQLRDLAEELPPVAREVARLRLDGVSVPEIAARTGMSPSQAHNNWRHAEDLLRKLLDDPQVARRPASGRVADWRHEAPRLLRLAETLPPAARQVAVLRLQGLTHAQIAERIGRPVGTVASGWKRALDTFTRTGELHRAA